MSDRGERVESDRRVTVRLPGISFEPAILSDVWRVLIGPRAFPTFALIERGWVKRRASGRWVYLHRRPMSGEIHLPVGPEARTRRGAYEAWAKREGLDPYAVPIQEPKGRGRR